MTLYSDRLLSFPGLTGNAAMSHAADRSALLGTGGVLIALALVTILFSQGASVLLEVLYPLCALTIGYVLYRNSPGAYVGYTWWLFFLTPEIRRLVDYQSGWSDISPIMLAPMLVAGLTFFSALRNTQALFHGDLFPFGVALVGVFFGYAVGLTRASPLPASFALLEWGMPITFGVYVVGQARDYHAIRAALLWTFTGGTLLMGTYGIVQFVAAPPWDGYWMLHSGMNSIGSPEPGAIRVFSTLNAPGPFAQILLGGLLFVGVHRRWRIVTAGVGYTSFLLSLVRAAWAGWAIGFVGMMAQLPRGQRVRVLWLVLSMAGVGVLAITLTPPLRSALLARVATFGNMDDDVSLQERTDFTVLAQAVVFGDPVGQGLGSTGTSTKLSTGDTTVFDNGVVNVPYVLGWFGGALYVLAAILLFRNGWRAGRQQDAFCAAASGVALGTAAQMISGNTLIGAPGLLFWGLLGVLIAHRKWTASQEAAQDVLGQQPTSSSGMSASSPI